MRFATRLSESGRRTIRAQARGSQPAPAATYRYVLMLCEDGSHGLDLSFVTHLFLINEVSDPAKRQQVVSRAHRMGATGPVVVEPVRMWDD